CRACFEVYDTTGGGKIDYMYLGSLLRALDLSVTEETVKKHGGTKKEGKLEMLLSTAFMLTQINTLLRKALNVLKYDEKNS
ncbi:hypothetical protein AVEN_170163-1, partial [Araneus ventricosus]